jgi:CubicO group peptidase (beta-lactamase class C family)
MAIERRALFALSIAFTASIVAYPDLPPEIPPRAGIDGAFIGAPFVAFLLPITSIAIWWILATLCRRAPGTMTRSMNAGAATAIFLSAFHVIMLIGFIGGRPWLGRILGIVVGVFLIVTGNDLPRLRPGFLWGVRTSETPFSDLQRRVRRLGGYIRVIMGLAICGVGLVGAPWLTQVIVLAVGVESVARLGATLILSRQKSGVVGIMLVCCCGVAVSASAQGLPRGKIEALPAFIDETVPKLMEQGHVPGAAVAIVHAGRVVLLRGYGQSRLDDGTRVDPARTLFRIGSVSKVFTSVAVLQLAERGTLDLQRDIRAYVPDIPLRYGATTHQLLTHTAGLDERFAIASNRALDRPPSLADRLRLDPPKQAVRPGTAYSYSNSNFALAGLVVEKLGGLAYEEYMTDRVFSPLRMIATTAGRPADPNMANLARGYRWTGNTLQSVPQRFGSTDPAGGISTTAADMGRFMLALLSDGSIDGGRILSPASVKMLLAPQYTPDPRISPRGYAFLHWFTRGHHLQHHDGTLGDHISVLVLEPDERFGIFVASNSASNDVGNQLLEPLLTYVFGPTAPTVPPPSPLPDAVRRAQRFAGTYRDYRHTRNDMTRLMALMPMIQSRVTTEPDGAIRWKGHRWLEVEPMVFRSTDRPDYSADGPDFIVFREDDHGAITQLHAWGATYERIGWAEQAPFHLSLFACCVITFLAYGASRGLRELRRRPALDQGRVARRCALFVSLLNIVFVAGLPLFFGAVRASTPLPPPVLVSWLALPLASVAVTALLPGFAAIAWREAWWTRRERLGFSAFAALSVAFVTFLNYWKLLGIRY